MTNIRMRMPAPEPRRKHDLWRRTTCARSADRSGSVESVTILGIWGPRSPDPSAWGSISGAEIPRSGGRARSLARSGRQAIDRTSDDVGAWRPDVLGSPECPVRRADASVILSTEQRARDRSSVRPRYDKGGRYRLRWSVQIAESAAATPDAAVAIQQPRFQSRPP